MIERWQKSRKRANLSKIKEKDKDIRIEEIQFEFTEGGWCVIIDCIADRDVKRMYERISNWFKGFAVWFIS